MFSPEKVVDALLKKWRKEDDELLRGRMIAAIEAYVKELETVDEPPGFEGTRAALDALGIRR